MGKYMRKSKTTGGGEVALMDVVSSPHSSSLGVRTRAKTLALQRLQSSQSPPPSAAASSYIQLRSRRLVKPPVAAGSEPPKRPKNSLSNPNSRRNSSLVPVNDLNSGGGSPRDDCSKVGAEEGVEIKKKKKSKNEKDNSADLRIEEASFGENLLEFNVRERTTRESTPCSLIRDPDTIRTPGSSTRPTTSADDANRRVRNSMQRHIPTSHEMDEFFAMAEEKQQKQFMDKYNFDPVNEKPLTGRFEWVKVEEKKC